MFVAITAPLYVLGDFRRLVDVNFICSMGPPGGGRNPVTARLLRHFNFLAFTEMEDPSKRKIFSVILQSWLSKSARDGGRRVESGFLRTRTAVVPCWLAE